MSETPQSFHDFGYLGQGTSSHGTRANYQQGCRCLPCRSAESCYQSLRAKVRAHGGTGWTDATATRDHLAYLSAHQVGLRQASHLSGVSVSTLQALKAGQQRVSKGVERRVLMVRAVPAYGARINSYRVRHLLRCLKAEGFTGGQLAAALGLRGRALRFHHESITVRNALKIRALYRRLTAE